MALLEIKSYAIAFFKTFTQPNTVKTMESVWNSLDNVFISDLNKSRQSFSICSL